MSPKRVKQFWRVKGGKKPDNVVIVSRPSRYGNPYKVEEFGQEMAVRLFEQHLIGKLAKDPKFLAPLRGKDLACYCNLDEACHADVLLRYTNQNAVSY